MANEQQAQAIQTAPLIQQTDPSTGIVVDEKLTAPKVIQKTSIKVSPEEFAEAQKRSELIPVPNRLELLSYGKNVSERLSGSLGPLLTDIQNQDTGEVGELLGKLEKELEELEPSSLTSATLSTTMKVVGKIPYFGKKIVAYTDDVQQYFKRFQQSSEQIRSISTGLETQSVNQRESYGRLESHKQNMLEDLSELRVMIIAGELRIQKENEKIATKGEKIDGKDVFAEEALKLTEHRQQIDALERRVNDLRHAYITTLAGIASVAMSQESALSLIENIESSVPHQIRLFVQMVIQAKASYDQAKAVAYIQTTRDTTNNMMKSAGEMFKKSQVGTKELEGEAFISTEAVKQYSDAIISTTKTLMALDKQNRAKRAEAVHVLSKVEQDIKQMLIDVQAEKVREASGTNRLLNTMSGKATVH